MLRLGKLTDYAILIMSHLAQNPTLTRSASAISESLHLKTPTVSKILKILGEYGLVQSVRGVDGGYHLGREASAISVADIIAAMEGQVAMTVCCKTNGLCAIDASCTLRDNWRQINSLIHNLLARLSITDMSHPLSLKGLSHGQ